MSGRMLRTAEDWSAAVSCLRGALNLDVRLPNSPFTFEGEVWFTSENEAYGGDIGLVVQRLIRQFGDSAAYGCQIDPARSRTWRKSGTYPGFVLTPSASPEDYVDLTAFEPAPWHSISSTASVFCVAGTSAAWALWMQPRWDVLAISATGDPREWQGPASPIRWFEADEVPEVYWAEDPNYDRPSPREQEIFRRAFTRSG